MRVEDLVKAAWYGFRCSELKGVLKVHKLRGGTGNKGVIRGMYRKIWCSRFPNYGLHSRPAVSALPGPSNVGPCV